MTDNEIIKGYSKFVNELWFKEIDKGLELALHEFLRFMDEEGLIKR